jgi:outer membrane receptor for ferrienterochelin and colicins
MRDRWRRIVLCVCPPTPSCMRLASTMGRSLSRVSASPSPGVARTAPLPASVRAVWRTVTLLTAFSLLLPAMLAGQETKKEGEESLLLSEIPSVFGASRFNQAVTEAPASVSVITSDEIVAYGWRTLGDLLRTVRGFYVTNDRSYDYVGTRGFGRPADYNSRILILLDGARANENIFDGGYVGMESLIGLSDVDRVEVIRGPASSLYGTNAFFGIVNIITHRGRARSGMRVTADAASFGTLGAEISGGGRARNGIEFYGSANMRRIDGQDHYYAEFDSAAGGARGVAVGRDVEQRDRLFGKVEWGSLSLEGALNARSKDIPTAAYGTNFNAGRMNYRDVSQSLALRFQRATGERSSTSASIVANRYDFDGAYPYATETLLQQARGRWAVAEAQYTRQVRQRDRIVLGGAYTHNWRQEQRNVADVGQPSVLIDNTTGDFQGVFALAEIHATNRVIVNAGLRYDYTRWLGNNWNPRAAVIYTLGEGSALKLLYGNAYRAPNNFERFYNDGNVSQKANLSLTPERVTTYEALIEQVLSRRVKFTASVYRYRANQLIDLIVDPVDSLVQYNNVGRANGAGVETELEVELGRMTGRASYVVQRASNPDADTRLTNSPQHLGALNATMPFAADRLRVGVELRALSSRLSPRGDVVGGHIVSNLIFSSRRLYRGIEATAVITNLFDSVYGDPVGPDLIQRSIRQDGRALRFTLGYAI